MKDGQKQKIDVKSILTTLKRNQRKHVEENTGFQHGNGFYCLLIHNLLESEMLELECMLGDLGSLLFRVSASLTWMRRVIYSLTMRMLVYASSCSSHHVPSY